MARRTILIHRYAVIMNADNPFQPPREALPKEAREQHDLQTMAREIVDRLHQAKIPKEQALADLKTSFEKQLDPQEYTTTGPVASMFGQVLFQPQFSHLALRLAHVPEVAKQLQEYIAREFDT